MLGEKGECMTVELKRRDCSVIATGEVFVNLVCDHKVHLAGADLAGANLVGANLVGANLADANLADANLACANLAGAKLAGAKLAGAYLAHAKLAGAKLAGANLAGANLAGANLAGADLAHADLTGAKLADAKLACANLAGAYLEGTDLAGVKEVAHLGQPDGWAAWTYIMSDSLQRVRIGCRDKALEEGRAYWQGKDDRREVVAALDYAEAIGRLRGWRQG